MTFSSRLELAFNSAPLMFRTVYYTQVAGARRPPSGERPERRDLVFHQPVESTVYYIESLPLGGAYTVGISLLARDDIKNKIDSPYSEVVITTISL